jgi:hypothetical protein
LITPLFLRKVIIIIVLIRLFIIHSNEVLSIVSTHINKTLVWLKNYYYLKLLQIAKAIELFIFNLIPPLQGATQSFKGGDMQSIEDQGATQSFKGGVPKGTPLGWPLAEGVPKGLLGGYLFPL